MYINTNVNPQDFAVWRGNDKAKEIMSENSDAEFNVYGKQNGCEKIQQLGTPLKNKIQLSISGGKMHYDIVETDKESIMPVMIAPTRGYQPFLNSFTYMDSLVHNWNLSTNGGTSMDVRTVKDESVVGMDVDEFLGYVRENGLDKSINWNTVKGYFQSDGQLRSFEQYVDYSAAMYTTLESRIKTDFTGEEQSTLLDKLNSVFAEVSDEYCNTYADKLTDKFNMYGTEIPKDKLYESIRKIFDDKMNDYKNFLDENPDYSGLSGSEDKWLVRDDRYMVARLQSAYKSTETTLNSIGNKKLYSLNDILALGSIASITPNDNEKSYGQILGEEFFGYDEESIGLNLSELYLKTTAILDNIYADDEVRQIAEKFNKNYATALLDGIERAYEEYSRLPGAAKIPPLERESIFSIIEKAMESYNKTNDISKSIKETADYAYITFDKKRNGGDYEEYTRYQVGKWNNFYGSITQNTFDPKTILQSSISAPASGIKGLVQRIVEFNSLLNKGEYRLLK